MLAMTILDKYDEELKGDVSMDAFTVHDRQLVLPAIKHKWVGRLMRHKIKLNERKHTKKVVREDLITRLREDAAVRLSQAALGNAVDNHDSMRKLTMEIEEERIVIEYLEKIEKILSSMTFDIRNLTEIMKLETQ
jgi:hypothetical protein